MAIVRGTGNLKRHGSNYATKQAEARVQESVRPYQLKGLNALRVDSFDVNYYQVAKSSRVCTCKQVEVNSINRTGSGDAATLPIVLDNPKAPAALDGSVKIDYSRPLFGYPVQPQSMAHNEVGDDQFDIDDEEVVQRDVMMVDQVFNASAECGICYKQGFVPGYVKYGQERRVLTTHVVAEAYGYNINYSMAPNRFENTDPRLGYISFELEVPLFFKAVEFSVRDNVKVLSDEVLYDSNGSPLTTAYLKTFAGNTCLVQVKARKFTHAVVDFNVGSDPVKANLAQGSKTLDWTMFDTFGGIQIILPMTIATVTIADVVNVPVRNMSFKITDVNYLRTATGHNVDWSVNVRILQPQESLKTIHVATRIW